MLIALFWSKGGISFFPSRLSIQDVSTQYAETTDTRGNPTVFTTSQTSNSYEVSSGTNTPSIISSLCLDGSCISLPQVGQPDIGSYSNILNINPQAGVAATTQYA